MPFVSTFWAPPERFRKAGLGMWYSASSDSVTAERLLPIGVSGSVGSSLLPRPAPRSAGSSAAGLGLIPRCVRLVVVPVQVRVAGGGVERRRLHVCGAHHRLLVLGLGRLHRLRLARVKGARSGPTGSVGRFMAVAVRRTRSPVVKRRGSAWPVRTPAIDAPVRSSTPATSRKVNRMWSRRRRRTWPTPTGATRRQGRRAP